MPKMPRIDKLKGRKMPAELRVGYKVVVLPKTRPFRTTFGGSTLAYDLYQTTVPEPGWGPMCVMYALDSAVEALGGSGCRLILRVHWTLAQGTQVWRPREGMNPAYDRPALYWGTLVALADCVIPQAVLSPEDISNDPRASKVWNKLSMAFGRDMYRETYDRWAALRAA